MTDDSIFSLLCSGVFERKQTRIEWQADSLQPPADMAMDIDRHWRSVVQRGYFNGRLARLDGWQWARPRLSLFMRPTDYQTLLYSNASVEKIVTRWGERFLANALGISAVVISADGTILLMKRSNSVGEYPACYDVFGGHIDCPANGPPDVFAAMAAELREELALQPGSIRLQGLGLISAAQHRKPELLFSARTSQTADEVLRGAQKARDRHEFVEILQVPERAGAIERFLQIHGDEFSPSAFGCLKVYLQQMRNSGSER